MFKSLLSLLESRGCFICVPVNMGELYQCVLDTLPIQDLLNVCDENSFTKCVSKCYSNFLSVCQLTSDMGGDSTKVIGILDSYELALKGLLFKYIVSPDHIAIQTAKLLEVYLEYESLII